MPSTVHDIVIDWSYPQLDAAEQRIVRCHEAQLRAEPDTHTADTLEEAVALASRELAGRRVVVGYTNDEDEAFGFTLRDGLLVPDDDAEIDEAGVFMGSLGLEDYEAGGVTRVYVALFWPQPALEALRAEAARRDLSLSALTLRILELDDQPRAAIMAPRGVAATWSNATRRKQSVYLPPARLTQLRARAVEADCSMSTLVLGAVGRWWSQISTQGT